MRVLVSAFIFNSVIIGIFASTKKEILEKLVSREIQVVAPASGSNPEQLNVIKETYPSLNLVYPENFINLSSCPFHSNNDEYRSQHLKKVLTNGDSSTVIWCLRGGYGTARIIDDLYLIPKPVEEKLVVGYSDITALHLFLSQAWGWKSVHGQILLDVINDQKSTDSLSELVDILIGNVSDYSLTGLKPLNNNGRDFKEIAGKLTGGNLCLLENSLGTKWQINADSKIIFTEDVHVNGYEVDRMLNHLNGTGILDNVRAVVFGEFADAGDDLVEYALNRFSGNLNVPVFQVKEFGHGEKNFPLIYNADAVISCSSELCEMKISV